MTCVPKGVRTKRKSSWWIILVALLTITAPTAFADSYSIVFTGGPTLVDASISVSCNTLDCVLDLGTVTDTDDGNTYTSFLTPLTTTTTPQTDTYEWEIIGGNEFQLIDLTTSTASESITGTIQTPDLGGPATVTLNTVAAPEPSSLALMLLGIGFVFVKMRKRVGQGLPLAT